MKIGIIFGGRSEHLGSIQHAMDVISCLKHDDTYEVVPIYITMQGAWLLFREGMALPFESSESNVNIVINPQKKGLIKLDNKKEIIPLDFVFPLVLGDRGEDGTIQGLLELANIPYAGSSVLGSALGMDKIAFKMMLESHEFPISPYCYTTRSAWHKNPRVVRDMCHRSLELPWFVKPANMGSSIGITKVYNAHELEPAINDAAQYDSRILIEQAVEQAREIEIAVLGNDDVLVSAPGEITCLQDFFNHTAKYKDGMPTLHIPAPGLSDDLIHTMQSLAKQVYRLINCSGFARIDFLVRGTDNKIFISEINTIPGVGHGLMFTHLWMAQGYSYMELLQKIISLGFLAHEEKQKNRVFGWDAYQGKSKQMTDTCIEQELKKDLT